MWMAYVTDFPELDNLTKKPWKDDTDDGGNFL